MKKIEEMTIPELVAEWHVLNNPVMQLRYAIKQIRDPDTTIINDAIASKIAALSRALDAKCEEAGVKLWADGVVSFTKLGDRNEFFVCPKIYAPDLHALLGYLLEKQR